MHFPNVLWQYTLHYVKMMDNATHLLAAEPSTVQVMHKTPSFWTRAECHGFLDMIQTKREPASLAMFTLVGLC